VTAEAAPPVPGHALLFAFCQKELPFAEYSVVKEHRALARPKLGGEYRARTGDLLVANQALSQLS
jgi:hypothetical protein